MNHKRSFTVDKFICRAYYTDNKFRIAGLDPNSEEHFVFYSRKMGQDVPDGTLITEVLEHLAKHSKTLTTT